MSGKKFRFSLASVLKLRSHEAECARQDLVEIRKDIEEQKRVVADAEERLADVASRRAKGATGQRSLSRFDAFRQEAQDELQIARRTLAQLREREEECRLQLLERKGAEEAIRRLEEREKSSFWKAFRAAETQQLDEQAISGFQRQRRAANS